MNYIIQYRQKESFVQQTVVPGDPLPGSRRWLPDPRTGQLRPELRNSLTSAFSYVDLETGELHEEHVIGLCRRYWALRRRARLAFKTSDVFMLTMSNLGTDADQVRADVSRALTPLRRSHGAHWLAVVEEHAVSDDLHAHVLIHAPKGALTPRALEHATHAVLTSERSTVKVDQATTRDSAEKLAAYVAKSLRRDPDKTIRLNTPSGAKKNAAYSHTRGYWGRGGWLGVYRNNLAAYRDENKAMVRAAELLEDQALAVIEGKRSSARTILTITLFSTSSSSCKNCVKAVRAGENDENNPQNRRARHLRCRAPPPYRRLSRLALPPHPRKSLFQDAGVEVYLRLGAISAISMTKAPCLLQYRRRRRLPRP